MIDENGIEKKGRFSANSRNEVISMIRKNSCFPVEVEKVKKGDINLIKGSPKVKAKDIAIFCRGLSAVLKAGAPLIKSLEMIQKTTHNKKLRFALKELINDIQKGESMSDGMDKHKKVFPEILRNMIKAGEMSGTIDLVCERMAIHYEKENRIKQKVKTAMMYPIILVALTVIVVMFLMTVVMPQFLKMFTKSGMELPLVTRLLFDSSRWIRSNILGLTIINGAIFITYRSLSNLSAVKIVRDKIKLNSIVFGDLRKKVVASRFARTMASMIKSGIPIVDSMEAIESIMDNEYLKKQIRDSRDGIMKGNGFAQSIENIHGFPEMISSMALIGEESGKLEELMDKTADFFDMEIEDAVKRIMSLLEPILIVSMAIIIGFIVISIMIPMFDMANTVGIRL